LKKVSEGEKGKGLGRRDKVSKKEKSSGFEKWL
jgi:hypothetical protein